MIPMFGVQGAALAVGLSWVVIAVVAHRAIPFESRSPDWKVIMKTSIGIGSLLLVLLPILWYQSIRDIST